MEESNSAESPPRSSTTERNGTTGPDRPPPLDRLTADTQPLSCFKHFFRSSYPGASCSCEIPIPFAASCFLPHRPWSGSEALHLVSQSSAGLEVRCYIRLR